MVCTRSGGGGHEVPVLFVVWIVSVNESDRGGYRSFYAITLENVSVRVQNPRSRGCTVERVAGLVWCDVPSQYLRFSSLARVGPMPGGSMSRARMAFCARFWHSWCHLVLLT